MINGTISNRFCIVSPRYNLTSLAYDLNYSEMNIFRKPQFGYSEEEWLDGISNPVVIHFNKSFLSIRPWIEGSCHPYSKKWIETRGMTSWGDKPLKKRDLSIWIYLIKMVPRKIMIQVAGFLHAYIKPLVFCLYR